MRTKIARIMASRETIVVKRTKGKGSKIDIASICPVLISSHTVKKSAFTKRKVILPKLDVIQSAIFSAQVLFWSALALILRRIFFLGMSFSPNKEDKKERRCCDIHPLYHGFD